MKLVGVAWQGFAVPFRGPYVTSGSRATVRHGLLLFLRADSGLMGVGEASPVGAGSRAEVKEVAAHLERKAPRLLVHDVSTPDAWRRLLAGPMPPVLRFGVETALLDLAGKSQGVGAAQLLGGTSHSLPVNFLIASETAEEAVEQAKAAVDQGFTSLKLKVAGGTIEQDEALVSSVRLAVGPGVRLRLDPNQGWSVPQAVDAIRRLAPYGLEYVEQPVPASDLAGLREVRRAVSVPVAADEALASIDDFHRLAEADAADLFVIKAGRLGGLSAAMTVMRLAGQAGRPVVVTSSLESGVGLAASTHLAATLSSHPFAHGLATGLLLEDDLLSSCLVPQGGMLPVPRGPGLGVVVNERALDRCDIGIKGSVNAR